MIFSKPLFYIRKVKDHSLNKKKLLDIMSGVNQPYRNTDNPNPYSYISNTDWNLSQVGWNWFEAGFSERDKKSYFKFLNRKFKATDFRLGKTWFNQYSKRSGSEHGFHNHEGSNQLTNIYYLELKDKSLRTILKHPETDKDIIPRVNEGDLLTFDSLIFHKSPPNFTDNRKTIISFNTSCVK
tara:strand:- start:176 stop:721 length:546 start_codon:yes stop_codon:yes gene_type:complete